VARSADARWQSRTWTVAAAVAVIVAVAISTTVSESTARAAPAGSGSSTVWLGRPGLANDPCESSQTATVIAADGSRSVQRTKPASDPAIDCFYVYPTVSAQSTVNADLTIDPEEVAVAKTQASRFSSDCRVYAPMYRQVTVGAIAGTGGLHVTAASLVLAYTSMLAGWRDYLAHYNHGRGVVLLGHSQGSALLIALLRAQIDPNPSLRRLLVSAVLPGGNVTVASGQDVGGDFQHIPACESETQTGCVVAYSSFLQPPPPNSLFGRVGQGVSLLSPTRRATANTSVLCVNPASLTGGSGPLEPYFLTQPFPGPIGGSATKTATTSTATPSTPWVTYPSLYTAQCEQSGGATWLQVTDVGGAGDHRPRVAQVLGPTWGLHLDDVNLALGNLVTLVHHQAAAYRH
jgi:hypothetical protein